MSIIGILTDAGAGGTFLTWSLHYLAGHTSYFNSADNCWVEVVDNPITSSNSHNFKPNQPNNYTELNQCLTRLKQCESDKFQTIYFHPFRETINQQLDETTKAAATITPPVADRIILLTNQPKNSLYFKSFRSRVLINTLQDPTKKNLSNQDQLTDFINYYFKDDLAKWQELNLTEVWDIREFLALNLSTHEFSIADCFNLHLEHFDIDCLELFTSGESLMPALFDFLETDMDPARFKKWTTVYQTWRQIHFNRLNFLWCFDKIINYILKGHYMDLTRFDLDIVQEAFIQHELLHKHQLGLKTWQLEKFNNTQQLHQLLETNIHSI